MIDAQINEVQEFLDGYKVPVGYMPDWVLMSGRNWQSRWTIVDAAEIPRAQLCFESDEQFSHTSLCLVVGKRLAHRIDLVPADEEKDNPYAASKLGLPATIRGSHSHPWAENREWLRLNGFGHLPFRKPIEIKPATLNQALVVFAEDTNLTLLSTQRDVRLPPQAGLFDRNGGR